MVPSLLNLLQIQVLKMGDCGTHMQQNLLLCVINTAQLGDFWSDDYVFALGHKAQTGTVHR